MASRNKICTLKVGEIEKNPILALSTSEKDVERHGRVTQTFAGPQISRSDETTNRCVQRPGNFSG